MKGDVTMNAQAIKAVTPDGVADYIKAGIRTIINTGEPVSISKTAMIYRIPASRKTVLCQLTYNNDTIAYKEFANDRPAPAIWTTISISEFVSKFLLISPIVFKLNSTSNPQKPGILHGVRKRFSVLFQKSACPCFFRDGDLWGRASSIWFVFRNFVPWAVIGDAADVVLMMEDAFDRVRLPQFGDLVSWYTLFADIVKEAKASFV